MHPNAFGQAIIARSVAAAILKDDALAVRPIASFLDSSQSEPSAAPSLADSLASTMQQSVVCLQKCAGVS